MNLYTADFIGNPSINFVKGTAQVEAGGMRVDSPLGQLGFERGDMTEAAPQSGSVDVTIGVRPEQLSISRQAVTRIGWKAAFTPACPPVPKRWSASGWATPC